MAAITICSHVQLCATLWTVAPQAPLSKGFFRQEYWSGLPCLLPEDLLNSGIKPGLLSLLYWQVGSLPLVPPGAKSGDRLIRYVNSKLEWNGLSVTEFLQQIQFSSVAQSCPTLRDPMNRSMPGLPVHHQLPESTQTHVHRVGDAIQPSHPLSSPSPPAFNLS